MNHTLLHLISIAVIGIIGFVCNLYVSHRLIKPRYGNRGVKMYMTIHVVLLLILATIACIANFGGFRSSIATLVWVMYGFMLMYLPKLCYTVVSLLDYLRRPRTSWAGCVGCILAIVSFITLVYGAFNRYKIHVEEVTVTSSRLPQEFDNYKIVQISDFHLETLYSRDYAQKIVDSVNALQPDVILYTGDIVNRQATELLQYNDILSQLDAPDGVYTVMGNHDYGDFVKWETDAAYRANRSLFNSTIAQMDWVQLDNETAYIHRGNDSIAVIGVENWGEPPFQQYGNLQVAYPALHDHVYKILLSHNPRHWRAEVLPRSNVDLMLSGHTHALQCRIGDFSPAVLRYPEWGGLYREGNQYLYVNVGIGCTMMPARIGAAPEITVITLQSEQ